MFDLLGKAGHVRTVPVPGWVKQAIGKWKEASGVPEGTLFRSINKAGRVWGNGMTQKVLWGIVREAASRAGIEKLAPHDLRRTSARLCHLAGGELDHSIPARPRLRSNDRTISRVQAKPALCGQLPTWH